MTKLTVISVTTLSAFLAAPVALADQPGRPRFGISGGALYATADELTNPGWHVNVTGERLIPSTDALGIRGTLGYARARHGDDADAAFQFVRADLFNADLFSPGGGLGLYRVNFKNDGQTERGYQLGVNAGGRFIFPIGHWGPILTAEVTVHRLFGDGPDTFITLSVGAAGF